MKKIGFSIFASLLFTSGLFAQRFIEVKNPSGFDCKGELVEVDPCCKNTLNLTKPFILTDINGKEVGYQLVYNNKKEISGFLFQANVKAGSSSTYQIKPGKPAPVKAKTFGRFVPERKDDFAWENDFAAYRMYGPALAKENPSNGVDFWAKKTDELIVNEFYEGELKKGLSYHRDRGHGLDFYKVAHTLGCGGVALYFKDSLWVGNHFDSYKVLENGPLRTIFELTYDSVKVGDIFYKETITITSTAGSLLNKGVVKFSGDVKQQMQIATGIYLHGEQSRSSGGCTYQGTLTYFENSISEFKEPVGQNYVSIYVPTPVHETINKNSHALMISDYKLNTEFTYYFGAGWNEWKYPTDIDWHSAFFAFWTGKEHPMTITIK